MSADLAKRPAESPRRVLDPVERMSEVLFGLIMALTFTGSISAASAGREEIRTMLVGAIGCNLAWGVVDAVMYLLSTLTNRARDLTTLRTVRRTADPGDARRAIADALPPLLASLLRPADYERLHSELTGLRDVPERARLHAPDYRGAAGVFLLVFVSTFPMVVPFLILQDPVRALRASHAVGLVMLFLVGHRLGAFSGQGAWRMGFAMVGIGVLLVALTILLGG
ncbi:MAG TPA: VIT1/CCC1 transporter family protein [Candidatus Cryosericum sp.]|nr:VIT1/CCC1 transporter family protein [Candidatus Cryosericum sp.]